MSDNASGGFESGMSYPGTERFLQLLTANNKRIYSFIFMLVADYFDADDIMQETVTHMYRNFDDFEPGTNFAAWGMKIAHYRVLSFRRKQKSSRVKFSNDLLDMISKDALSIQFQADTRLQALHQCRKKLNDRDREMINMLYDLDMSVNKVSKQLQKSIYNVYRAAARIHDTLLRCVRRTIAEESQ